MITSNPRIRLIVTAAACALLAGNGSAQPRSPTVLERFLARTDPGPDQYRALRHLDAHNMHFGASAWMDVWTEADGAGGFRYEVASEGGSGYIRRHVFLAALAGERKLLQNGEPQRAELNLANYMFEEHGAADGLASLGVMPRRKDILLVDGAVFVKPDDSDLVRIEGRLSKNPSFWTRRVEIVRRYDRINGVRVPLEIQSTAQVLIAGASTFRMTYEYETINGERVGNPKPRARPARGRGGDSKSVTNRGQRGRVRHGREAIRHIAIVKKKKPIHRLEQEIDRAAPSSRPKEISS